VALVKVTKEQKEALAKEVWGQLYPQSVKDNEFIATDTMTKAVIAEYTKRLRALLKKL